MEGWVLFSLVRNRQPGMGGDLAEVTVDREIGQQASRLCI
jgi:hypothetical protein